VINPVLSLALSGDITDPADVSISMTADPYDTSSLAVGSAVEESRSEDEVSREFMEESRSDDLLVRGETGETSVAVTGGVQVSDVDNLMRMSSMAGVVVAGGLVSDMTSLATSLVRIYSFASIILIV